MQLTVSMNPCKVSEYLAIQTAENRPFVEAVLNQTNIISMDLFKAELVKLQIRLLDDFSDKPFYVVQPQKQGSEQWVWSQLPMVAALPTNRGSITSFDQAVDTEPVHILVVDDCIYSGNNICGLLDDLSYEHAERMKIKQKNVACRYSVIVATPFATKHGQQGIADLAKSLGYLDVKFACKPQLTAFDFTPFDQKVLDAFEVEYSAVPRFFEHKMPNQHGSFPQIYLRGLIPGSKKRCGSILMAKPVPPYRV